MEYNYNLSSFNLSQLEREIRSSAIITALDYITSLGQQITVSFKAELSVGDKTILDGIIAAHVAQPEPDLPTIVDLAVKSNTRKLPKVEIYEPEGTFYTIVSHDLTDKTTWYQASIRVTDETLTLDSGLIYNTAHPFVIDLSHGKVTKEDSLTDYFLIVKDGATILVEETDYTVDYVAGQITLTSSPSGTVTASYSYADKSCFRLAPSEGKILTIQHAEVQFTKDIKMTAPLYFDIYAYNPYDLPNKFLAERVIYKNVKDIINIANLGQGFIPAFDTILNDVLVFPFDYARTIDLKSSMGLEIRVCTKDDVPYNGEFATITFYCVEEDEDA